MVPNPHANRAKDANPGPGETGEKVYDLGSGDGRIALAAGREFGARAVGIEINPSLVGLARLRVAVAGLRDSVEIPVEKSL